jgi:SAM-dependent methyltransferase
MVEFLYENGGRDAGITTEDAWDQNLPSVLSRYIQAHYGSMSERVESCDDLWTSFVRAKSAPGVGLYSTLLSMLSEISEGRSSPSTGLAVDAGCSVGKMAYELAADFDFTYGVDLSFGAVMSARRIIRHSPTPQTNYRLMTDAGRWSESIPINVEPRRNVEFLVASATALPLDSRSIDCLSSINLIDVLPQPEDLFKEAARVLGEEKFFILADPYCWRDTSGERVRRHGAASSDYVGENLLKYGFTITRHEHSIPWLLRLHDRSWDVYLCDCFGAVKSPSDRRTV